MAYSILIIKTGALGDVLRSTTLLKELRDKYSEQQPEIYWITSHRAKELLINNQLIDYLYLIEDKNSLSKLPKKFNLIISLDDEKHCAQMATDIEKDELIGAYVKEDKVTYTENSDAWFGMGLLRPESKGGLKEANRLKKVNKKNFHELMAKIADVTYNKERPFLNLTEKDIEFSKKFAKNNNLIDSDLIIGLNTGAGKRWQQKRWSTKKTAQLADRLISKLDAKIVLLGGKEEKERNDEIKKLCKNDLIDAGTENSIREFASIINLCDLVVTSDTLAMYITIALGKKLVVIIGPTSIVEIEIYDLGKKIYADMDCICCYKKTCEKNPNCMDLISVDEIFDATKEVLNIQ